MTKTCFSCNKEFESTSFKTPRSRFKSMGLQPPEGMGETDRVCSRCVNKIHAEELKRIRISQTAKKFSEIPK